MKDVVLLELANRWEREANQPTGGYPDSPSGHELAGRHKGERETLRMCADGIRMLVDTLGEGE
jgi:hypothetical protein